MNNHQPFPHIIVCRKNGALLHVVTDSLSTGDQIIEDLVFNSDNGHSMRLRVEVTEIIEQRKARGDWSNWKVHPNWYKINTKRIEL